MANRKIKAGPSQTRKLIGLWRHMLLVFFGGVLLWTMWTNIRGLIIKYEGETVTATVASLPERCGRSYSRMYVTVDGRPYRARLTRTECRDNELAVGQKITVIKHGYFKRVVRPDIEYPESGLLVSAGLILVILLLCRPLYLEYRNKQRRMKARLQYYAEKNARKKLG